MWKRLNAWFASRADVGLLVARLWIGGAMITHGVAKVLDLGAFSEKVARLGFPFAGVLGPFAALSETLGAALLLLGLLTRPAAVALTLTMLGAAFGVHWNDPFTKKELALTYATISLALLFTGPGRFSLDRVLFGREFR
ncbi:MAG: DoxX family protein [Myxococcales bacterium]